MFLCACEGFLDKESEVSATTRLQTFYLLRVAGSKVKRPQDLWVIEGEQQKQTDTFVWGSAEDAAQLRADIEKAHGIKIGNN